MWEMLIGLGLLFGLYKRAVVLMLLAHMPGAMIPMLILPGEVWTAFPFALTLEGQYIVKNLVLVGAAMAVGATFRDGQRNKGKQELPPVRQAHRQQTTRQHQAPHFLQPWPQQIPQQQAQHRPVQNRPIPHQPTQQQPAQHRVDVERRLVGSNAHHPWD